MVQTPKPREALCSELHKTNPSEPQAEVAFLEETPRLSKPPLEVVSSEPLSPNNKLEEDSLAAINNKSLEVCWEEETHNNKAEESLADNNNNKAPSAPQNQVDCLEPLQLNPNKLEEDRLEAKPHQIKEEGFLANQLSKLKLVEDSLDNNNLNRVEVSLAQLSLNKEEDCLDSKLSSKPLEDFLANHNSNRLVECLEANNSKLDHHFLEDNSNKHNPKEEDYSAKLPNKEEDRSEQINKSQVDCLEQLHLNKQQEEVCSVSPLKVQEVCLERHNHSNKRLQHGVSLSNHKQQLHRGVGNQHFLAVEQLHSHKRINWEEPVGVSTHQHSAKPRPPQ